MWWLTSREEVLLDGLNREVRRLPAAEEHVLPHLDVEKAQELAVRRQPALQHPFLLCVGSAATPRSVRGSAPLWYDATTAGGPVIPW